MAPGLPLLLLLQALTLPGLATQEGALLTTMVPEGGSVNFTCSQRQLAAYLKRKWPEPGCVAYFENSNQTNVNLSFLGRIRFSGPLHNLTFTMGPLRPADTGIYYCMAVTEEREARGPSTLVVVSVSLNTTSSPDCAETANPKAQTNPPWLLVVLAVISFLAGLSLGAALVLSRKKIKSLCRAQATTPSYVIYEDMSYSRRNTMSTPNPYH